MDKWDYIGIFTSLLMLTKDLTENILLKESFNVKGGSTGPRPCGASWSFLDYFSKNLAKSP